MTFFDTEAEPGSAPRQPTREFPEWWLTYGQPYEARVIENDGVPWTSDPAERLALWQRRHIQPPPPRGMRPLASIPKSTDTSPISPPAESDIPDLRSAA
jgi:hypothetical protein